MPPEPPPGARNDDPDAERARVATVLDGVRAGVLQRRADLATLGEAAEGARLALAELRTREVLAEPAAASPRPLVGRLLAFARKAFFHLFGKWYARPLVAQQNEHNRAVSHLLEGLVAAQERLTAEVDRLGRRVERLEERGAQNGSRGAGGESSSEGGGGSR